MKKAIIAIAAGALLLTACGSTGQSEAGSAELLPIDTGFYGITVPGDAVTVGVTESFATYELPSWAFNDAAAWMGDQLAPIDEVGGRAFYGVEDQELGRMWCYQTESDDEFDIATVWVGKGGGPNKSPVSMSVSTGIDAAGC